MRSEAVVCRGGWGDSSCGTFSSASPMDFESAPSELSQ